MKIETRAYVEAARVPKSVRPKTFGVWTIQRRPRSDLAARFGFEVGFPDYTLLYKLTQSTMHQPPGEIVMEDSVRELRRHLPIWLAARGRVLITGLGLGCVVRGLLVKSEVEHIDVVEIDAGIIKAIAPTLEHDPRVHIHHGDALTYKFPDQERVQWDFAWHDIHTDDKALQVLHADLLARYKPRCQQQGAWMFPHKFLRGSGVRLLGGRRSSVSVKRLP